jgi:hypothetical protein
MQDTLKLFRNSPLIELLKADALLYFDVLTVIGSRSGKSTPDILAGLESLYMNNPTLANADVWRQRTGQAAERAVTRCLNELADKGILERDSRQKPFVWQIHPDNTEDTLSHDLTRSFNSEVLRGLLKTLLAPEENSQLSPLLNQITVQKPAGRGLFDWSDRYCAIHSGPFVCGHKLPDPDVQEVIVQALSNEQCFTAYYQNQTQLIDDLEPGKKYRFNPLWMVSKNGILYLVASLWDYPVAGENIRQFAVHRLSNAELVDQERVPAKITLQQYVQGQAFQYPRGEDEFTIRLAFSREISFIPYEYFLALDQRTEKRPDGRIEVTATVRNSDELRWWIRQLGSEIEVLGPDWLRAEFIGQIEKLRGLYSG